MRTSKVFLAILCWGMIFAANVFASEKSKVPILPVTSSATSVPCCLGNITDDFSDGLLSPFFRNASNCGAPAENSGKLVFSLPNGCPGVGIIEFDMKGEIYRVCGDFDAQVDFELVSWPATSGWRFSPFYAFWPDGSGFVMVIERYKQASTDGCTPAIDCYKSWAPSSDNCSSTMIPTGDMQGRFRIQRTGTTISSYYWSGSSWVLVRTRTVGTGPVAIGMSCGSGDGTGQEVRYDNLIIQSALPADTDADTVPDCRDNCPLVSNFNQSDVDSDTVGDSCDICPNYFNPLQEVIKPGDANASGTYTLGDAISIVNYIFNKPGCSPLPLCWLSGLLCRGDWDGSGTVTLSDAIRGVNYVFNKPGGPWTPVPVGACCVSPT